MTGTSFIPIIIVIIVVTRTRKLTNRFRNVGAINEENAKTLDELKMSRRLIFRKYLSHSVIIETHGKYYLNEQNLINYRTRKRMILIPLLVILTIIIIYMDIALT
jgi:hypothetical protein